MVRLMLVLGLVLSLAACGGSRTDGLSTSEEDTLEARLEAAEAERAQAEAGKAAAEADKAAAEAAKVAAEAAKVAAEADKAAAEAAKVAAEAAKVAAEADKAVAEADKVAAEADKAAAEADKAIAEAERDQAEAERDQAEADKAAAEADKAIAEAERDQAEADKAAAEADKAIAEAERDQAEADKVAAEADKVAAEADKVAAEADKAAAEAAKAIADAERNQAEAERDQAEADKVAAQADKVAAEAAKAIAQAAVQHQVREALRAQQEAADARQEAADARQDAADARQEAADARGEADTASDEAAAAERERARLAAEAAEQQQATTRAEAMVVLTALAMSTTNTLTPSSVDANYRATATVAGATFTSTQGSSDGPWYATTAQGRSGGNEDTVVVYTDVEAPESEPIRDIYPLFSVDYEINPSAYGAKVASSSFPSTSNTRIFDLTRRTVDQMSEDPPNLTARISGSFDGASGTFTCTDTDPAGCTVFNSGATYTFTGTWTFKTSSPRATVRVPDTNYMYFGWWRQKDNTDPTEPFSYNTFSTPGTAPGGSSFNNLTGSATYEGPAIGLYAIYQPLGAQSGHGEFKATARFSANFTANTLSGSVTGFDVNPDWSLTLGSTNMSDGTASGASNSVSWTIGDSTKEGGMWTGAFHSDANPFPTPGYHPDGLTGTFDANYDAVARIRGAYGAHRK